MFFMLMVNSTMVNFTKNTKRPCLIIIFCIINKAFDQLPADQDDQDKQNYFY